MVEFTCFHLYYSSLHNGPLYRNDTAQALNMSRIIVCILFVDEQTTQWSFTRALCIATPGTFEYCGIHSATQH